ncbi:MAG: aspartyl-trna synthetase [Rhodobacteraceae bacterium]|nr:aspartyl-trna synthetase [Paracoccaceae bacterium]
MRVIGVFLALAVFAATGVATAGQRGPVTNLPMPRFVSMKADEGNVRRGPSLTHRVDWVFRHENLPLQVTAEYGHWRRVQDSEGQGGWMHYSLLSGVRMVVIQDRQVTLRLKPSNAAQASAYADRGVIARLGDCQPDWCEVSASGQRGWVQKASLWGVSALEIRE